MSLPLTITLPGARPSGVAPACLVVTGGRGFVGSALCNQLARRWPGTRVRVPTRQTAQARGLQLLPNVDLVRCDVHDPMAMARLLDGAQAFVHLVAILHGDAAAFDHVHVQLPRHLAAAARAAGIQRVVHVSALGVADAAPSQYLRSKAAGEAVWRQSGLDVRVLRPSVIFGAADRFTNLFARLQRLLPVLPLAGADARFQPVWVEDVAAAIVALIDGPAAGLDLVQAAGPDVLTLRQIVQRVGQMAGCPRPVIGLPDGLARLQADAMRLLPGEPLMSRDNLLSMQVPNVADPAGPGLPDLGIAPCGLDRLAPHLRPALAAYDQVRTRR